MKKKVIVGTITLYEQEGGYATDAIKIKSWQRGVGEVYLDEVLRRFVNKKQFADKRDSESEGYDPDITLPGEYRITIERIS